MKPTTPRTWLAAAAALLLLVATSAGAAGKRYDGMPNGSGSYEDLVELYGEFLEWKDPAKARRTNPLRDVAGQTTDVYPDYSAKAVRERQRKMADFQKRIELLRAFGMLHEEWQRSHRAPHGRQPRR